MTIENYLNPKEIFLVNQFLFCTLSKWHIINAKNIHVFVNDIDKKRMRRMNVYIAIIALDIMSRQRLTPPNILMVHAIRLSADANVLKIKIQILYYVFIVTIMMD